MIAEPGDNRGTPEEETKLDEPPKKTAAWSTDTDPPDVGAVAEIMREKHVKKGHLQKPSVSKQVIGGDKLKTSSRAPQLVVRLERIDVGSFTPIRKDLPAENPNCEPVENLTTEGHSAPKEEEQNAAFAAATHLSVEGSRSDEDLVTEILEKVQQQQQHSTFSIARAKLLKSRLSQAARKLKVNVISAKKKVPKVVKKSPLCYEQTLFCEICGIEFRCFKRYWNHVHTVHAEHEFTCIVCDGNTFKKTASLLNHTKLKHKDLDNKCLEAEGDPLFYCEVCGLGFRHIQSRVDHIKEVHTDAYICCPYCTRSFSSLDNLLCHVKVHGQAQKTLYRCAVCCKKLYFLHMYVHHIQSHQNALAPKKFKCETCCLKINGISKYIRHVEQHLYNNPQYFCFICNNVFVSKKKLELHMKYLHRDQLATHAYILNLGASKENQKDVSHCYWCGKTVPSRYEKVHLRRHAKFISLATKKAVVCKICLKDVPSITLRTHMSAHLVEVEKTTKKITPRKAIECPDSNKTDGQKNGDFETSTVKKPDKSSTAMITDQISAVTTEDITFKVEKAENTSALMKSDDATSAVNKDGKTSDVNEDKVSVVQEAVTTSDMEIDSECSDLIKADQVTDSKKTEKNTDSEEPKETSNKTDLKEMMIDHNDDDDDNNKADSKKPDIDTDSKEVSAKPKSELVEITSASDLKKPNKTIDSTNTTSSSDPKRSGEIFDPKKSDNIATPENNFDKQSKKRKKSRFSSIAPLQVEPPRTPVQTMPAGPRNRNEPFTLRFDPSSDGPPGVDMEGPPGVDVFPKFQGPVPPGVPRNPFNYVENDPSKNVRPFNTMSSVGGPMGPMSNVGHMGQFNPMNPVDSATMGPYNTMGSVGPMSQGMDMPMYAQQNPGMPYFPQYGNQFQPMQGGGEPYFNQGMKFMDSGQYYGDPSMGGYQQFMQYMSQWSGSQMVQSGDVVNKPKPFSKNSTVCSGCEKEFGTTKVLAVHELFCLKLVEQLSKQTLHECPVCAQMFTSLAIIKQHMFQSHAQIFKEFNLISGKSAAKIGKDECKSCKQVFKSKEELAAHELTHEFLASLKSDLEKVDVSNTLLGKNTAASAKKDDTKTKLTTNIRKSRFDQAPEPAKTSSQATNSTPSTSSTTRQKATNKVEDLEQKLRETLRKTEEMEKAKTLDDLRSPSFKMKLEQQKKKLRINLLYYQKQKLEQEKQARSIAVQKADEELKKIQKELLESQKASLETIDLTQTDTFKKRSRSPYARRTGTRPDDRRRSRSRSRDRKHIREAQRKSRSTSRDRYVNVREGNPDLRRINSRDPRNRQYEQSPNRRERLRSPISPRARGKRSLSPERYGRNVSSIPQRMSPGRPRDMSMIRPRSNSRERERPEPSFGGTFDKARPLNIKPGEEMRVYKCTKCATLFTNYRDFIRHNDIHEDEEDDEENYLTHLNMAAAAAPAKPTTTTSMSYTSRSQTYTSYPDDGARLEKNNPVVFRDYFGRSANTHLPAEEERDLLSSTSRWQSDQPRVRASVADTPFLSRRRDVSPYRPQRPRDNVFPIQGVTKTTPVVTAYAHLQQKQQYIPSRIVRVKCRVCSQEFSSQEYLDYHACPGPF